MVTMKDVAARAGVSCSAVSHVLNNRDKDLRISAETRARVLTAVREMNYRRNQVARAMVRGKTDIIAFLCPEIQPDYISAALEGAAEEANRQGFTIKIFTWKETERFAEVLNRCVDSRPRGLLVRGISGKVLDAVCQEARRLEIPIANLDCNADPTADAFLVRSGDREGCRLAVEHLVSLGHYRIVHLTYEEGRAFADRRLAGFLEAMSGFSLPVSEGNCWRAEDEEMVSLVAKKLSASGGLPTAIFCASDWIAMRALRALRRVNLRVPEDISLVGFADLYVAKFTDPPLTTIRQPFADIGRAGMKWVAERAKTKKKKAQDVGVPGEIVLPVELVVRESTKEIF